MTRPTHGPDGVVYIKPAETMTQVNRLETASKTLLGAWQAVAAACNPAGKLGGGPMGKAFKPTIDAATNACAQDGPVSTVADFYQKQKDNATDAVRQYQGGEAEANRVFTPDR